VLLGEGCLCYSLVLAYERHEALTQIASSYRWILERVSEALAVPGVEQAGISDLVIGGQKFSGNAQQRKRRHLLHHGTILYALELGRISRYLRQPPRQPDYREGRDHETFIRNLGVPRERVVRGLREVWAAPEERASWPAGEVARLVQTKYATPGWTVRR
jgi:lipoate-protein ligase A